MKEIDITSPSEILSATLYEADKADAVLVLASATGVKQGFYRKFAQFLTEKGITVITFDYCGIG
ncbi:MAG TPA: hypothetical protein DCE41_30945 [Cytophagales bacterium]|nr:hypothetical protein [Cytophagales bacterium]HAP59050.1 hypothetical protein [Cytophagales bacterium]